MNRPAFNKNGTRVAPLWRNFMSSIDVRAWVEDSEPGANRLEGLTNSMAASEYIKLPQLNAKGDIPGAHNALTDAFLTAFTVLGMVSCLLFSICLLKLTCLIGW